MQIFLLESLSAEKREEIINGVKSAHMHTPMHTPGETSCSPDSQEGEQAEDLCGSDPGSCAQQVLVKVGGTLWIQPFFPGTFNHPLQLRDAWYRLL